MGERSRSSAASDRDRIEWPALLHAFARIGLLSFGGPAAQIALMYRILVDERRWLAERQFLDALSFCMLLPGPEAMQLATYAGWRLRGVPGGLAAGLLFVLPGALVVLALSVVYVRLGALPLVEGLFFGVKAAVLVIVIDALIKLARRSPKSGLHWAIAGLAFVAIFFLALPFPLIIALAAVAGLLSPNPAEGTAAAPPARVPWRGTLARSLVWLAIWLVPLLVVGPMAGAPLLSESVSSSPSSRW